MRGCVIGSSRRRAATRWHCWSCRAASAAELAGGFGLPSALPLSSRIEESFRRRLEALPPDSQLLLLLAAADPIGEPVLVWRAAERLGIGPEGAHICWLQSGLTSQPSDGP
jgi:hypothetical protein